MDIFLSRERVLVIEGDSLMQEQMKHALSKKFKVVTASTGAQGVEFAFKHKPQVIVLEAILSDITGIEVCRRLRNDPTLHKCCFVFVSSVIDPLARTEAFNAGADDYLEKPFNPEELIARVASKMKRVFENGTQSRRVLADIILDFSKMCLMIEGREPIKLGVTETKILNALLNVVGKVLPRKQLSNEVWGEGSDGVVDPHITSLRKKLTGANVEIKTVYGEGYCIAVMKD